MTICYIFVVSICIALCFVAGIREDESEIIDINDFVRELEKTDENTVNEAISNEEVDELIKEIIG